MKKTEYFVSLKTRVAAIEECNFMVNTEKLIGTVEYLTLWTRCLIYRSRYNWVRLHMKYHLNNYYSGTTNFSKFTIDKLLLFDSHTLTLHIMPEGCT